MRTLVLIALLPLTLAAFQSRSVTTVRDINGRAVEWSQSASAGGARGESVRNLNGIRAPIEEAKEEVLRDSGGVRIVQRTLTRYGQDGRPLPPERTLVETTTRSDGSSTERTTIWRGDINGQLRPIERSVRESSKSGDTVTSQTAIERPNINGGFQLAERRNARETTTQTSSERDEIISAPDANGHFKDTVRTVTRSRTVNGQVETRTDEYEAVTTGALILARQSVARKVKDAAGERQEIDVYGPAATGRVITPGEGFQLRERQIYTSSQSADGSVVQVFAIQRPSLNSSRELGPPTTISETVCRGKCQ